MTSLKVEQAQSRNPVVFVQTLLLKLPLYGFNLRGGHFLATADQAPFRFLSNLGQQLDRRGASDRSRQLVFQRRKMVFKVLQGQARACPRARACRRRCLFARQLPEARGRFSKIAHRSEEHTSELQSPCNLVCRLLLEKKKKKNAAATASPTQNPTTNYLNRE